MDVNYVADQFTNFLKYSVTKTLGCEKLRIFQTLPNQRTGTIKEACASDA